MSFDVNLKLYAIREKRMGKDWSEIQLAIHDKFNVKPPNIRSLQMWQKETEQGVLNQALKEQTKKEAEDARSKALYKVAEELLPRLWQARDAGEDIEYEGWRWFFSIIENTMGSEKFNRFMQKYLDERKGKHDIPSLP